jgi:acyl dehydratase
VQGGNSDGDKLHHEDLVAGWRTTFGRYAVRKEEILAFAQAFDPQPLANENLCASPLHVCTMMMRMFCDGFLNGVASLGSPGVDRVQWMGPVCPGEILSVRVTIAEKRDLVSRPDVGMSKMVVELLDGTSALVASWITNQLTKRRQQSAASAPGRKPQRRPPLLSLWDNPHSLASPGCDAFFEDCQIGEVTAFGRHAFGKDEIISFAREFDPQPFHIDEAAAKASLFGALCASGWHTAAISHRLMMRARAGANAAARERGARLPAVVPVAEVRSLQWPKPVYAGDSVEFRGRLMEKSDAAVHPEHGIVAKQVQGRNQRGEIVFAVTADSLVERRAPISA